MNFKDLKNLGGMMKNMQEQMQEMQETAEKRQVTAEAGAGMVKVTMNGKYEVVHIELDDNLLQEEKTFIADVIAAGVNAASKKIKDQSQNDWSGMATGMNLPKGFPPLS